jgi:hypothetical protein
MNNFQSPVSPNLIEELSSVTDRAILRLTGLELDEDKSNHDSIRLAFIEDLARAPIEP